MRSMRQICLVSQLGCLALCLFGVPAQAAQSAPRKEVADEIRYEGLTLDEWRDRIKSLDPRAPEAAEAVNGLLQIVKATDAPWFTRRQAALTLGRIGQSAAVAVPVLQQFIREPVQDDTASALWAMKALALFGPVAAPATPAISQLALSPGTEPHLQLLSIEALCRIGPAHPQTLPTVIALLQQDQPLLSPARMRSGVELDRVVAAIQCLELFGSGGADAVPVLLRYSEDREERVRRAVAVTLGAFGPRGSDAAQRLAEIIVTDQSLDVRDVAAISLGQVGGTEWLGRLIRHPDAATRERACVGLGYSSPSDNTAQELLTAAERDQSSTVRIAAIETLQRLTKDSRRTAPAAARELASEERSVRLRAIRFLTQLGPKAGPAREQLEQLKHHTDPQVSRSATRLLESLLP